MNNDCNKLINNFIGSKIFLNLLNLSNPEIHSPTIENPAFGTFSISILPFAPTNKNFIFGKLVFSPLAMDKAG